MAVTHAGMNRASSRSGPGGSRRAARISSAHPATINPTATASPTSHSRTAVLPQRLVDGPVDLLGVAVQKLLAALEALLPLDRGAT
jgi:hypothetical protein